MLQIANTGFTDILHVLPPKEIIFMLNNLFFFFFLINHFTEVSTVYISMYSDAKRYPCKTSVPITPYEIDVFTINGNVLKNAW